jgi:hypothetical protein
LDFAEVTVVEDRADVARHFKVSERSVYRWEKAGMPVLPGGRYDLVQIALWHKGGKESNVKKASSGQALEQERLTSARADRVEMENAIRRGELIELAGVEALLAPRAMAYRQGIVALQRSLPPRLSQCKSMREMEAVIAQAGRELLANVLRPLTLGSGQVLKWDEDVTCRVNSELNNPAKVG